MWGGALDLPWTAKATQKKITHNRIVSRSERTGNVVDEVDTTITTVKDVEFDFPLYWAVGVLWRWTQLFYSTLDVNYTGWSDFAFQAEGGGKINPLDGSPHGQNPIDDTWAIRTGMEYLFLTRRREIPVRAGFAWEQRPALNAPDEFMSVSA
ncbi:MAG: long-subunit fatty acid transport protein, partial [Kiritimatiellia bacterium]